MDCINDLSPKPLWLFLVEYLIEPIKILLILLVAIVWKRFCLVENGSTSSFLKKMITIYIKIAKFIKILSNWMIFGFSFYNMKDCNLSGWNYYNYWSLYLLNTGILSNYMEIGIIEWYEKSTHKPEEHLKIAFITVAPILCTSITHILVGQIIFFWFVLSVFLIIGFMCWILSKYIEPFLKEHVGDNEYYIDEICKSVLLMLLPVTMSVCGNYMVYFYDGLPYGQVIIKDFESRNTLLYFRNEISFYLNLGNILV